MDIFAQMAQKIIEQQEGIIGPIALDQAKKVEGLTLDWGHHQVSFTGDKTAVLEHLIENYQHLFGLASVEVCRDAVKAIVPQVPKEKLPKLLQ
jgi:hypothetical protein